MTNENKTSKYLDYGRLEFTVGYVAEGKENDKMFAVYCDESVEGEFPHSKLVAIFKTREEAENCTRVQNLLHSISQGFYYTFRVEEISTLSKPKGVEKYQAEATFYYFDKLQYDGKKVHSSIRVIVKDNNNHKDGEVVLYEYKKGYFGFYKYKWTLSAYIDLDETSTKEKVVKRAKKLTDDYLINKGLISEPFE